MMDPDGPVPDRDEAEKDLKDREGLPSRRQLARILGLSDRASSESLSRAGDHLLDVLERRHEARPEDTALAQEIRDLEAALRRHTAHLGLDPRRPVRRGNVGLLAALVLSAVVVIVLGLHAVGLREQEAARNAGAGLFASAGTPGHARLIITGELAGATLRVLDADREKLLEERPAQNAMLELRRGRYALEVGRPECPELWTRSVFLEAGRSYRFEPMLCSGTGRLAIRSNVDGATLLIDGMPREEELSDEVGLPAGEHTVRIEKPGYRSFESVVEIRAGETADLRADLRPEGPTKRGEPDTEGARTSLAAELEEEWLNGRAVSKPAPFDLGDFREELREELTPERAKEVSTRLLERSGLGVLPAGGSTAWHDRVSREFVSRFDRDGSGAIDQVAESESISCAYWRETESSFDRGGLGLSMARYYGFDGSEWHPGALGFSRSIRSAAYERMRACGLQS